MGIALPTLSPALLPSSPSSSLLPPRLYTYPSLSVFLSTFFFLFLFSYSLVTSVPFFLHVFVTLLPLTYTCKAYRSLYRYHIHIPILLPYPTTPPPPPPFSKHTYIPHTNPTHPLHVMLSSYQDIFPHIFSSYSNI